MAASVTTIDVSQLTDEQAVSMLETVEQIVKSDSTNQLLTCYQIPDATGTLKNGGPYDWQQRFHDMGATHDERAIIAGHRTGKTRTIAAEIAIHLTGQYPSWWKGYRFTTPIEAVAAGTTNSETRDIVQKALLGPLEPGERSFSGTGWIPKNCIGDTSFRQCGVVGVADIVRVQHVSGGWSDLQFKSYEQGAAKFQGVKKHLYWMDEEPENDDGIFPEIQIRLMDEGGLFFFSRTPLFGYTYIVKYFMDGGEGRYYEVADMEQAFHMDADERDKRIARMPPHERECRAKGIPMMGSGMVYPVPESDILCPSFQIPPHFRRIAAVDFGIDHPAAGAWIAYDADHDIAYLTDCYKQSGETAAYHSAAIRQRGDWIPVAWPHDGLNREKSGGQTLAGSYRSHGVNMMAESARYDPDKGGGQPREPGTVALLERMLTGRFKVFDLPANRAFLEEKRMLHRKTNKITGRTEIVAIKDDIESAVRYNLMSLNFAISETESTMKRPGEQEFDYSPLDAWR